MRTFSLDLQTNVFSNACLVILLAILPSIAHGAISRQGDGNVECTPSHDYDDTGITIAVICLVVGLLLVFAGYKLFLPMLFTVVAVLVTYFVWAIMETFMDDTVDHRYWIIFGVAIGCGLIAGLLAVCFVDLGIVLVGFAMGCVIGYMVLFICGIWSNDIKFHPIGQWLVICVTGIIFAVLTWCLLKKFLLILVSAVVGSFVFINGLDYFVGSQQIEYFLTEGLFHQGFGSDHVCYYTWILIGGAALLAIIGFIVQWFAIADRTEGPKYVIARGGGGHRVLGQGPHYEV